MKIVICILLLFSFLFSCGGTCIECHPKLVPVVSDTDHSILNACVSCHNKPVQHGNACGQDCFDCHQKEKLYSDLNVAEHQALKECFECHKDRAMMKFQKNLQSKERQKTLKEILN